MSQVFLAYGLNPDNGDEQFHAFDDPDEAMAFVEMVDTAKTHDWTILTLNTQTAKQALEDYTMWHEMEGL